MSDFQIKCDSESRKKLLHEEETINGIDYIEVKRVKNPETQNSNNGDSDTDTGSSPENVDSSSILLLLFLFKEPSMPDMIKTENLIILGGTRIRNIGIKFAGRSDDDEILGNLNENEKEIINGLNNTKRKKLIVIKPKQEGDFSVYTLKLIENGNPEETLSNFDPIFSQIDFSFKIDCNRDFDCKVDRICPPVTFEEPLIDYMAKDYASFVKLILSRFSHIIPEWKEKSAADLTNVLIELLSYVGDHLSYYQDSISTEAYLGTAKKRISIKRHARLLDYFINEGSNSRTWVCFEVDPTKAINEEEEEEEEVKELVLKKSTKVLTAEPTKDHKISISEDDDFKEIVSQPDTRVFETMHKINLYSFHNEMFFYTWDEANCCIPTGATNATLMRDIIKKNNQNEEPEKHSLDIRIFSWETIENNETGQKNLKKFIMRISSIFHDGDSINITREDGNNIKIIDNDEPSKFISIELLMNEERAIAKDRNDNLFYEFMAKKSDDGNDTEIYGLSLSPGDVLIFEEKLSPITLDPADRDPSHRQAIKLRDIKRKIDPINKVNLVEIYWDEQDALRFPLCINKINSSHVTTNSENNESNDNIKIISVARGNVALVDHGYTLKNEKLENVPKFGIFYPKLDNVPITFASPFIPYASAYSSLYCKKQRSDDDYYDYDIQYPQILIREGRTSIVLNSNGDGIGGEDENEEKLGITRWYPSRDLLSSDKFAREFVVEIDNDGPAYLRFGDGKNGQKPESRLDTGINNNDPVKFYASYRIGNGRIGNVGSETIKRIVENKDNKDIVGKIKSLCNPLPAIGGTDQESLNEVRQSAPVAFMRQERAVTENDYVSILRRHPDVQRSVAMFRWTGSWYTVYVTIDRIGGKIVDESFKKEIYSFLNKFRLAGYDLEINSPNFVPLDIEINICVKPNHYPEKIKKILLNIFSTHLLEGGQIGFFHPDNFTFGQPLYLSKIYQTVMNVEGVESVFVNRFQRLGKQNNNNLELEKGMIGIHSTEIIRLDNDPNFPDNGKIEFVMRGGI